MPIPAGVVVLPPQIGEDGSLPSEWPTVTIEAGNGRIWDLTDPYGHVQLQPGWSGFDLPPAATYTDKTPGLAGASYQGSTDDVRPVFVPVYISAPTRAEALEYRREFLVAVHHSQGPAVFTVAETDGTRRRLTAVYTSGGEGIEAVDSAGLQWAIYGLNFLAADEPYWVGDPEAAGPFQVGTPVNFYPMAGYGFRLSPSSILGAVSVANKGDVDAYPTWVLEGPATSLTLQLGTRVFTIAATLSAGQTLTINTNPASQTIVDNTGANRWGDVDDDDYDLWELPPGPSNATVSVAGGGAATRLRMSYQPRYLLK